MSHNVYPSLRGKRVVVTGGGSGIGAAITELFARQGSRVAFIDIADADSRELERKLADTESPPRYYRCDLTNIEAIRQTFARIKSEIGPVDVLVNNAANDDRHSLQETTEQYWDNRIAVNLRHLFFCTQAVTEDMKSANSGVIINLGSVSWHLALPDLAIYQTAKAGIEGMTRALARDLGPFGIRVSCVIPVCVRPMKKLACWACNV